MTLAEIILCEPSSDTRKLDGLCGLTNNKQLTPLAAARSQLLTAIDLFFADADPVSVHTLAGAAQEILESMCRLRDIEPMTDFILKDQPGKTRKDIHEAMNLYRNCFKHIGRSDADRNEHQAIRDQYREPVNEFYLYVCVEDYVRLTGTMPVVFQVFQIWFAALHLELLLDEKRVKAFTDKFPGLTEQNRGEQKRRGREMIAAMLHDQELLADSRTEPSCR